MMKAMNRFIVFVILLTVLTKAANGQSALALFTPLDTNYRATVVLSAPSLTQSILFREGVDWVKQVRADGYKAVATAPPNHDYMYYIADARTPNHRGRLIINHENISTNVVRPPLGEGGGMSIVDVERVGNQWRIVQDAVRKDTSISVDFTPVGWTMINCGGGNLSNGNFLTGEEIFSNLETKVQLSNYMDTLQHQYGYDGKGYYTIPSSVPDFGGKKIAMQHNFGWMVEVNPNTSKAVRKLYHAGRFSHEGGTLMSDGKTIIVTNDFAPAVLFKFVADRANDFSSGSLYCFKQDRNAYSGKWILIERNLDSLIRAPQVAMRKGATLFMRLEWSTLDPTTKRVYLSETGADAAFSQATQQFFDGGASIPWHWINDAFDSTKVVTVAGEQRVDMPYGNVLVLEGADTDHPSVRPYLKGGFDVKRRFCFTSPDGMNYVNMGGVPYLIVQEDAIGQDRGRVHPLYMQNAYPYYLPKTFLLDLRKANPTPDDLLLLAIGSPGAEFTGACSTPDGSTIFLVNQHPLSTNPAPFNTAAVVALTGFNIGVNEVTTEFQEKEFICYPNPTLQTVFFNHPIDGNLIDTKGQVIEQLHQATQVSLFALPSGVYYLQSKPNETVKIIKL